MGKCAKNRSVEPEPEPVTVIVSESSRRASFCCDADFTDEVRLLESGNGNGNGLGLEVSTPALQLEMLYRRHIDAGIEARGRHD